MTGHRRANAVRVRQLVADRRPTTERREPGISHSMYPYVALRCPTYRENSHANHTWHQHSHEAACFLVPEAPSPWVRFPSPAPLLRQRQATQSYKIGVKTLILRES